MVGGYKMLWVVIYFEQMSQYTLLGRDEGEGAGLAFYLAFAKSDTFSYTVI